MKLGELIIAASVIRVLAPPTSKLCATGVAQFVHTPSGAPATAPHNTFPAADSKLRHQSEDVQAAARQAGRDAQGAVVERLRQLLETDIDEQWTTPLSIVRDAVVFPSRVLQEAGVPPVERDEFAEAAFPGDEYGLAPATFTDVPACSFFNSAGYRCCVQNIITTDNATRLASVISKVRRAGTGESETRGELIVSRSLCHTCW